MENKNIETRIKDIAHQIKQDLKKDYNKKMKNKVNKEKEEMLNKLFEMFPDINIKKDEILTECLKNKSNNEQSLNKKTDQKETIFDQFTYNGNVYYKDKHNAIWNNNAELVGSVLEYKNNIPVCSFFDEKIDISIPHDLNIKIH